MPAGRRSFRPVVYPSSSHPSYGGVNFTSDRFASVMVSGEAVTRELAFALNSHVVDDLCQVWHAAIQSLEKVLKPEAP